MKWRFLYEAAMMGTVGRKCWVLQTIGPLTLSVGGASSGSKRPLLSTWPLIWWPFPPFHSYRHYFILGPYLLVRDQWLSNFSVCRIHGEKTVWCRLIPLLRLEKCWVILRTLMQMAHGPHCVNTLHRTVPSAARLSFCLHPRVPAFVFWVTKQSDDHSRVDLSLSHLQAFTLTTHLKRSFLWEILWLFKS